MTRTSTAMIVGTLALWPACGGTVGAGPDTEPRAIDCADGPNLAAALVFKSIEGCDRSLLAGEAIADGGWGAFGFAGPPLEEPLLSLGQSFDVALPQSGWFIGLELGYDRYASECDLCDAGERTIPTCPYDVTAGSLQITYEPDPASGDTDDTDAEPLAEGWISGTARVTLSDGVTTFPFQHTWDRAPFRQVRPCGD